MAATDINAVNGLITYQGSGFPTLDGTIIETMNRDDIMPEHKQYMELLGFTETPLLNPSMTFAAKSAPKAMGDVLESGIAPSAEMIFTPKKWVYQIEIANKFSRTKLFTEWARKAKTLQGAPDSIQAELLDVASETRYLYLAYDARIAEEMVKVLTKGFSGGRLTPKGKNLFDTHTYGVTGSLVSGTFTNFTNGAITFDPANDTDVTNGTTRLQTLINQLKAVRDENGKFIKQGSKYVLYCSRIREVFWKKVLNNESKFSGQGTNAMSENQFRFAGNIVEIRVIDLLGQPDYAGTTIGTSDMIFVSNLDILKQAKALKLFRLYPLTISSWENQDTKVLTVDARAAISCDHFGAELYLCGSTNA